jgi:4-amino-4-deoxy-L-arabinose transferase-like glycosyltransferase
MLNNDGVAYMLAILALYFTLKWWKGGKNLLWIALCGLSVGLGMMAKLSSATVCLPIAGVFIYEFILTLRKKENSLPFWRMAVQYVVFLCICAPIGLWFQVYAKQRFGQDFGYVWNNLTDRLYTGDKSWFSRFVFAFDASEFFDRIYCYSFDNYYLFNFALRSSIFGEQSYERGATFAGLSVVFAYVAAIALAAALIWCLVLHIRNAKNKSERGKILPFGEFLFVLLLLQSQVISEIHFYVQMPYGCTMDFRYIMPMILALGLTVGCVHKTLTTSSGKTAAVLNEILLASIAAFLVCSSLFYLTCA